MINTPWLFKADWLNPVFMHFAVDPGKLQPHIPFELDQFDGKAFVSLVAFTQSNLRPVYGGKLAAYLSAPLATHAFLNLRTYVRVGNDRGIYFISEWIPNRLAALIGPPMYGLPYRLGRLRYHSDPVQGAVRGTVAVGTSRLEFLGMLDRGRVFQIAQPESLYHFLVERYIAFTHHAGVSRRFLVDHDPWPIVPVDLHIKDDSLLQTHAPWLGQPLLVTAHYSPGVKDVCISRPLRQSKVNRVHYSQQRSICLCPKPMSIQRS